MNRKQKRAGVCAVHGPAARAGEVFFMSIFNKKGEGERQSAAGATKAYVILQRQAELSEKLERLLSAAGAQGTAEKPGSLPANDRLLAENAQLRKEINYVAAQCENIFIRLSGMITSLDEKVTKFASGGSLDDLAGRVADKLVEKQLKPEDYDDIARRVASYIPQEVVPADYIASKVAEQVVIPPAVISDASSIELSAAQFDPDALADEIARKVSAISPNEFDIVVDDDGCRSLAEAVAENLDYDGIARKLAERGLGGEEAAADADELSGAEEVARLVCEKLAAAGLSDDSIADKTAAAVSNVVPDIDGDDIADKVAAAVLASVPAPEIDYDAIASGVAEKLSGDEDAGAGYEVTLDDGEIDRMAERITSGVAASADGAIGELKEKIAVLGEKAGGVGPEELEAVRKDIAALDRQLREIKAMLAGGAVAVAGAMSKESPASEQAYGDAEAGNEPDEEQTDEAVPDEAAEEEPSEDAEGGVDFINMMKYDRSFIARIIQSSDDVKRYYGRIKNAMLAYKKVNSSIAWSAERFNKGRETIAKLKIRGKTLCLYLNLDPKEYKTSVYHHADVSGNKSMHGTPMMVKIKSPLGVKKAMRLIDDLLAARDGEKRNIRERDYAAMYPYETIEELIEDGLVKNVANSD